MNWINCSNCNCQRISIVTFNDALENSYIKIYLHVTHRFRYKNVNKCWLAWNLLRNIIFDSNLNSVPNRTGVSVPELADSELIFLSNSYRRRWFFEWNRMSGCSCEHCCTDILCKHLHCSVWLWFWLLDMCCTNVFDS